jgi:peptidyl-prolyl cis-trans isomerase D
MNFFRRIAAPFMGVVIITFLAWMVLELSGITGSAGFARPQSVGKVEGRSLDSRLYEQMVQRETQDQQQQTQATLGSDDYARIRDKVWNEWVDQAVLEAEYDRRGISVSDQEVVRTLQTTPLPELVRSETFQTDGRFDIEKYRRWLASANAVQLLPVLEDRYRQELKRSKLLRVVTADVFVSDADLWQRYRDVNEMVKIDLAAIIPRNAVPDSAVTVTDAEVEQYYRDHQDDFKRPETAYLSYVTTSRETDASDSAAALARITQVRAEILGGARFEDVARRESQDAVSAAQGGSLGTWKKGQMVAEFETQAAKLPLNKVSEPFLTSFGYHILEVTARTRDSITGRHILVNVELAGAHRDSVDAAADALDRLAADRVDPAALDTAARVLGLRVGHALPVQRGTTVQAGTKVVPNVGTWAFQRATPGAIGQIEQTGDALYLFRIDSMTPAGVPPLATIRDVVTREARGAKKWEAAKAIGANLQKRLDEGATLDMAARALGLPHQVVGPFSRVNPPFPNPTLAGAAFSLLPKQRSGILDTPDGYYLIESVERTAADSAAFVRDIDRIRDGAIRQARQDRARLYLDALRQNAKIVDRREEIQRANEQAQAALEAQQAQQGTTRSR